MPAWARLVEIWVKQIKGRSQEIGIKPIMSVDEAMARNVKIGIIMGLKLGMGMPAAIINGRTEEIDKILEEIRNATEQHSG